MTALRPRRPEKAKEEEGERMRREAKEGEEKGRPRDLPRRSSESSNREGEGDGALSVTPLLMGSREGGEGREARERLSRACIDDAEGDRAASHEKRSERARRSLASCQRH